MPSRSVVPSPGAAPRRGAVGRRCRRHAPWRTQADPSASLVVSLVAPPMCIGVAVASGVPAEPGLVTGVVGALVAGALPGSSLQVSGPAAGLTVLVYSDRARPDALATMAARSPCRAGALARGGAGGDRDRGPRTPGAPRRGPCLLDAVRPPPPESLGRLTEVGVLGAVAAFALIASAESLFGAVAVDRLHRGKRADHDRESMARGWGSRSAACRAPCR
ncbi:SulP family inorganic anion transporter [Streptomyces sp. NPDC049097]|uniref:SulP family inorganic anion transporter n=1 Tax=Streptomyces sp. NPDC049097 TaxID=3155497 RepID=UPI00344396ED